MGKMAIKLRKMFDRAISEKVISLDAMRKAEAQAEENIKSMPSMQDSLDEGADPLHALYANTQNLITIFAEQVTTLQPLHRINDFIAKWEDTYCPALPPMSPISKSYFNAWVLFDVAFGLDKETVGTCFLALMDRLPLEPIQREIAKNLNQSRMGIYEVVEVEVGGKLFLLRELVTDKQFKVMISSGYAGEVGDLIFIRLVPPLVDSIGYHIGMTTPYILEGQTEEDWLRYFERHEIKQGTVGVESRLQRHMKYGKNLTYWSECIFYGYSNYEEGAILMTGFPDQPETQPQHESG